MGYETKIVPAKRTWGVEYAIRDIVETSKKAKAQGLDLIYLNIGDPVKYGFQTPKTLIEAAYSAMLKNQNFYSESFGIEEAISAIKVYAEKKGITPEFVFITQGASEAIELALASLANSNENIVLPCPCYPLYQAILSKLGVEARYYYLDEEKDWELNLGSLEKAIDHNTKAIVIINPNNPTGSVLSRSTLEKVVDVARMHRLVILSDEIYDQYILDEGIEHISIASLAKDVPIVTFNGLSKCYFAPGWRIGWGILSGLKEVIEDYAEAIAKFARARLCPPHPFQHAIPVALLQENGYLKEALPLLKRRRDLLVNGLNSIPGLSCVMPKGAFYAFPRINLPKVNDLEFVKRLILEEGVVLVHGSGFGQKPGTQHFRAIFLPEESLIEIALERIERFIRQNYL